MNIAVAGDGVVLTGGASGLDFKTAVDADTFAIYGGPGSLLGKYQISFGPSAPKSVQFWSSNDVTDQPTLWQSSTFNSPNGSTAMWAGQTAAQQPGWAGGAGYGNGWDTLLRFSETVVDVNASELVSLNFTFNHDTEPGYDFFDVEYDSAGTTTRVLRLDGSNKDTMGNFTPITFPTGSEVHIINFDGGDYGGDSFDEVVVRMAIHSDGAWSDEDGLWPTDGAAQVDNITISGSNMVGGFEDFEGAPGGFLWQPEKAPFG